MSTIIKLTMLFEIRYAISQTSSLQGALKFSLLIHVLKKIYIVLCFVMLNESSTLRYAVCHKMEGK